VDSFIYINLFTYLFIYLVGLLQAVIYRLTVNKEIGLRSVTPNHEQNCIGEPIG
jgi:hypothetical protein